MHVEPCPYQSAWLGARKSSALVAQSVEHHHGKVGVSGSNPLGGLFQEKNMANAKKNTPVEKIALQCTECKQKNYTTQKNRRNTTGKLELMKYCPFERKHTLHREAKIK